MEVFELAAQVGPFEMTFAVTPPSESALRALDISHPQAIKQTAIQIFASSGIQGLRSAGYGVSRTSYRKPT